MAATTAEASRLDFIWATPVATVIDHGNILRARTAGMLRKSWVAPPLH
jgi:hypothetical protein